MPTAQQGLPLMIQLALIPLLVACSVFFSLAHAQTQNIIINQSVPDQKITATQLRSIFSMKRRNWNDGEAITVVVLNDTNPSHIKFCKQVLNVYPHQMRRLWDRQVYSGTGQAPIEVSSEEEMKQLIASTPGAIGYIMSDTLITDKGINILEGIQR